jgi:hypothetical protein
MTNNIYFLINRVIMILYYNKKKIDKYDLIYFYESYDTIKKFTGREKNNLSKKLF